MNDQFLILCADDARKKVREHIGGLNVISIGDWYPDMDLTRNLLYLNFDDVDTDADLYPEEFTYCQMTDIQEAIKFAKEVQIDIIHCHAGLSRSPAIGYAVLRSQGYSKEDALKKILEKAPDAEPNKRIVNLADRLISIYLMHPYSEAT